MTFKEFRGEVVSCLTEALASLGYLGYPVSLSTPPRPELGDLASSVAFAIASNLKQNPMQVAETIAKYIKVREESYISRISVEKPGYINFHVNIGRLALRTLRQAQQGDYGAINVGAGKTVLIEHTSVNPNKALHVGHLRNVVLGDSLSRILKFTGHQAVVLNYVDDSGAQVADIIVGFLHLKMPREPAPGIKFDHYCGDAVYVAVNRQYEKQPELLNAQRQVLQEMEKPDSPAAKMAEEITRRVLKDQLETCWRIGARYDILVFESHILRSGLWQSAFGILKEKGLAHKETEGDLRGCWIAPGVEGQEYKVLVRSDGTVTYIGKDLAFAAWKLGLLNGHLYGAPEIDQPGGGKIIVSTDSREGDPLTAKADISITVVDVRQSILQSIISSILSKWAGAERASRYRHLSYEVVSLSKGTAKLLGFETDSKGSVQMSGRRGLYVNADSLLDTLKDIAGRESRKRNADADEEWLDSVAEQIAVGALRLDLLKPDLDKVVVFDLTRALSLEGDTGPYLQYAYARGIRILEKAGEPAALTLKGVEKMNSEVEVNLLKLISRFGLEVEESALNYSPKVLARYALKLASSFSIFYEKCPILREGDAELKNARLNLTRSFVNTLGQALQLLGIPTPERI